MAPNEHGHGRHYDSQTFAGDDATKLHRDMHHMDPDDHSTRGQLEHDLAASQATGLAPGVRMGDDRAIGSHPNWTTMSSTALSKAANDSNSPETADNLGRAFNSGGNKLAEAANRLYAAVGKLDAAWTGQAANSAAAALTPLAQHAGDTGVAAQLMGAQMSLQASAASEVRRMPPPKEFDYQTELRKALANPNPAAGINDMKTAKDQADAVKREQVSYLNTYTQTMSTVDSKTPSFVPPPPAVHGGGGGTTHLTGGSVNYRGPSGGSNQGTSTGDQSGPFSGAGPAVGGGQPGDHRDDLDLSGFPGFPGAGTGASGFTPGGPTTAPGLPGGGTALPQPSGPAAGSGGFGAGFGSFGAPGQSGGLGSAAGSGAGSGGPGERGAGGRGGLGAGGAGEPLGAGARGAAGTAAGRGAAGGPMGAGAGGRKEDDEEHERPSYLVEADPEGTFGTDEVTAPPVIGQD
jgi:hypothetical protein